MFYLEIIQPGELEGPSNAWFNNKDIIFLMEKHIVDHIH